ncbi:MAG: DNA replication/repair protein RecF [Clostridiales bacterium]|uniref:DNA replication/repair protein RecF n=1 Tax=Clostridium sp. N3C TaxID=1776758 RepID=UPI00092E1064|nr:DNA replication/repair protein RecF [Clostridium sp. N3C]NLZ47657.1 DNA replication/repair protein RecF [Clostridiales bacterium]SCN26336.1 DNA replication and repair protein RecF [Clostridium sp. N3C]
MHVKYLQLLNYRNYKKLFLELNENVNIFIGDNAQGKTNILESIYYCSFGRSHRTNRDKEVIKWNENEAYIKLYIDREPIDKKIEIKILKEGKKAININSIKIRKISELMGVCNVVMFSPEDLKIVKESPGHRRRFLNMELCQLDRKYYYNLVQYNKVLMERNTILKGKQVDQSILDIYDDQLATFGEYVIKRRMWYISQLNNYGKSIHKEITSNKEDVEFGYLCQLKSFDNIKMDLLELLKKNRASDIYKNSTSIGPHRDDFYISINGIDTRNFGSQGQQRTSVLTIKFASLKIIKEVTGEHPILLLDDVLSELDFKRQKYVLNSISDVQTIITCTGIEDIKLYINDKASIFYVKDGSVGS